jgi:hypothetical protein
MIARGCCERIEALHSMTLLRNLGRLMGTHKPGAAALALFLLMFCHVSEQAAAEDGTGTAFLSQHCYDCHGEDAQKGGLRLDTLRSAEQAPGNVDRWAEVYQRVAAGEMPPRDRKNQPQAAERQAFSAGLKQSLLTVEAQRRAVRGRVVLRRLNRVEYENTLNDLFSINVELKDLLPEDASADGFDNISAALSLSPVLLERYMEAADAALDAVFIKGPRPETRKWRLTLAPQKLKPNDYRLNGGSRILPDGTVVFFGSQPFQPITLEQFRAPVAGHYRFRISQFAYQSGGKPLVVAWYAGSLDKTAKAAHLVGHFEVPPDTPAVIEFTEMMPVKGSLKPHPYRLPAPGLNIKDTSGYAGPGVAIQWVEVEGPLIDMWPPAGYQMMLQETPLEEVSLADAEKALRTLAPRAFRRPVTDEDIEPYLGLVRKGVQAKKPAYQALRDAIKGLLCAPDFLFLREPPGPLDDFAVATRLSYFLWSSLPDDALMRVAASGGLKSPPVLRDQVDRMLSDPKAARFIDNFTGQWLGLRNIDATTPDKKLHPNFDEALQVAMVRETQLFFTELLRRDLSVRNFIHSDFAMVNTRLAELYRLPGVEGWEFRKVPLPPDSHRGGLLGQAAILKVTANGTTTSPVIRGSWVMKNILGTPVKPPPPDVPALEPDIRGATTIREQVAKHRANESCASCHDRMDPLGLALENYDVIGGWRTHYRVPQWNSNNKQNELRISGYKPGAPVDATGALADGRVFKDLDQLKQLLLADSDQVARCVAEKLLTYATGAGVTFADKILIEEIVKATAAQDHGLRTLLNAIVSSPAFLNK